MKKRGWIWDWDDTISQTKEQGIKKVCRIALQHGYAVTAETVQSISRMWGMSGLEIISRCWPEADAEKLHEEWQELDMHSPIPLIEGMDNVVRTIHGRGCLLSIYTARSEPSLCDHLVLHNFTEVFAFFKAYKPGGVNKPDPLSLQELVDQYTDHGISKDEIILIGDSPQNDLAPARIIGVEFIAFTAGDLARCQEFEEAGLPKDHIILSPEDILQLSL